SMNTTPPGEPNRYSEEQTKITAGLGALAQQKLSLADHAPNDQALNTLVADNQALLQAGQEKEVRATVAQASRQEQIDRNLKLQSDIASGKTTDFQLLPTMQEGF